MARRQALFPGDSEFQQLLHIFSLLSFLHKAVTENHRQFILHREDGSSTTVSSSSIVRTVGEDEFGYMLADILKENNVNNEGMRFDPGARTALAFVTLRNDGEREFMFYCNPSADMLLQETELDYDLIRKAKIVHYGSISLITEPCKLAHIVAAKAAKDAGVILPYDPNLRLPLWSSAESAREGILSIWEIADIIKGALSCGCCCLSVVATVLLLCCSPWCLFASCFFLVSAGWSLSN
ncbi:probable fructokinase-6, chloroplastic [Camellia sinensis]|uniref:probable fructokinase-6, chloroplastic n=1 Tax=Camellia sinensis TaxID=4442 RepID=UPI0010362D24|nr:probable fructokinase-6, chloroplastic [Camellia sinensis]